MRFLIPLATAAAVLAVVGCNSQPGPDLQSAQAGSDTAGPQASGGAATGNWTRELYVSPSGSDTADGSSAHPFQTIGQAVAQARPGDRITVRAGTYAEHVVIGDRVAAGTADKPIRLQGDGSMPKIVPDPRQTATLVEISQPHWQVAGFEFDVQGQPSYAVAFTGNVTGSVLSDSNLHGGTSGAGVSAHYGADGATIEHNEISHFWQTVGGAIEDSHGVLVQPTAKNITIRYNKIHENSGDAVQCMWDFNMGDPADNVLIEHNEMYSDYEQASDIKTCTNVTIRDNYMHDYLSTSPGGNAIVVHLSAANVTIQDNRIVNVGKGIAIGGNHIGPVPYNVVVRHNQISHVRRGEPDLVGAGIRIENSESAKVLDNTIEDVDYAGLMVGGGDQGATSNLTIQNNTIQVQPSGVSILVGPEAPGLASDNNVFSGSVAFSVPDAGRISLSAWQARGQDVHSKTR